MSKLIVHIADINISEETGMGRIAWHWKKAFENKGYDFFHIGPNQVGPLFHPALFSHAAYYAYKKSKKTPSVLLVHEPSSGIFLKRGIPTIVFSHGIERRGWRLECIRNENNTKRIKLRTRIFNYLWRLRQCDLGLRMAQKLLLSNLEDSLFAQNYYHREEKNILIFKNGVYSSSLDENTQPETDDNFHILFVASWVERKGISTMIKAAQILCKRNLQLHWTIAGAGVERETILNHWPVELRDAVEVIPRFNHIEEKALLARANLFVLPSFFEGQPLSLLQAMESGRCCITTNCCGQRDVIQHGYNGLLHEPGNANQLASLIEQCARDEELRLRLGRNARFSVKDRLWEVVSDEVVNEVEKGIQEFKR